MFFDKTKLVINHATCIANGNKKAKPKTAILAHFNCVVCIVPLASISLIQSKIENPIKLKTSIALMIHQKIQEIYILFTSIFKNLNSG